MDSFRSGHFAIPSQLTCLPANLLSQATLISILLQLHDELDAAVFDAYGWPRDLTDEQLLEKLVALNHERAEEEKRGIIRYLRPEFQKAGRP